MNLAEPAWMAGILAIAALAVVVVLAGRRHRARLATVFHPAWLARVVPASVERRRRWRQSAALLALVAAFVALAEPRTDKQLRALRARGTDLVIAVDLSRSMLARDVDPSRLGRARREVADLLGLLEADRVGLVVFAGGAYARLPLTADRRVISILLGEMEPDQFESQGSDLGGAIRAGLLLLSRDKQPAGKAIIVFSDGEVHQPDDVVAAAKEAADAGVPVYTVGVGLEAEPIPVEGGFLEWQGQKVTSTPDPEMLKAVARATGGAYVSSVASGADMADLVAELRRSLTSVAREQQQRETWTSLFQWPLGLSAVLLLFAAWLGDGRRLGGVLLVLVALGSSRAEAGTRAEADEAYRTGNYRDASRGFEELSLEAPSDADLLERLAASRYRLGDFEGAARAWDQASRLPDGAETDVFNAANAHYQAGRLERARELYDEVLAARPGDPDATLNRDLVEQEIALRRKAKPPPPPDQGSGENQEQNPNDGQDQQQPAPAPADPESGDPGDPEQGDPSGEKGNPQAGEGDPDPQAADGEQDAGSSPGDADPTAGDASRQGGPGGEPGAVASGPISAAQAERLLDGVEEGQPTRTYLGPPGGPPW